MPAVAPILGQIALNIGFAVGASVLQAALSGFASQSVTTSKGLSFELQTGEAVPVSCLPGGGRAKGQLVYINEYGSDNEYLQLVIRCAHGYHDPLDALLVDGKVETLSGNNGSARGRAIDKYMVGSTPYAWIKFYQGAPGQAADPELVARATNNRWGSLHKLTGCAYVIITLRYNADLFQAGAPSFGTVWGPLRVYDWRKDSTAGGLGTQRWGQPSTYAASRNPVVIRYNFRRGIFVEGVRVLGQGYPAWSIDRDAYTAAANVCDELVYDPITGVSYPRYEFGREVGDDEEKLSVLAELDAAYCGSSTRRGGADVPLPAQQQISVGTLTDGQRLKGRPISSNRKGTISTLATCWHGQFVSANDNYTAIPFTSRIDSALEASLGGRISRKVDQGFEWLQARAQARAEIELRRQRFAGTRTETFAPSALKYEVGDVLTRQCDWGSVMMQVVGRAPLASLAGVTLTLREWSNDIVPASGDSFVSLPATPGPGPADPTRLVTVPGLVASKYDQVGGGAVHAAIKFVWNEIQDETVDQIVIRVWPAAGDKVADGKTFFGTRFNRSLLATGLAPLTDYAYEATIVCTPYRATVWISGSVTTGAEQAAAIAPGAVDFAALSGAINAFFDDLETDIAANATAISSAVTAASNGIAAERTERLADILAIASQARELREMVITSAEQMQGLAKAEWADRQRIERSIVSQVGAAQARFEDAILLATGPSSSLYQRVTTAQAAIDTEADARSAAISAVETAYAGADQVIAGVVNTLATQIRGSYDGTDALLAEGLIGDLRQTTLDAFQGLSEAVTMVTAGVGILFDWSKIWPYDAGVDGWTGNGAPTWSSGWLRPADHATDPYILSPDNLGIDGGRYKQIKLRVKKTGSPTWEGQFWWQAVGDTTWDAARRVIIAEPSYSDGVAVITVDLAWTGTIKRVREDLSSAQDASNYFEVDWNAVGRPSPGASQAQVDAVQQALASQIETQATARQTLQTAMIGDADPASATLGSLSAGLVYNERQARSAADQSLSSSLDAVSSRMGTAEGDIGVLADAQAALNTTVSTLNGAVGGLANSVADINAALPGKTSTAVTDGIKARVDAIGDESVSTLGGLYRQIRSDLDILVAGVGQQGMLALQTRQQLAKAVVDATQYTNTSISQVGDRIDATGETVNAINGRLMTAEGSIAAQGSAIAGQSTTLIQQGNTLSSQSDAIVALQNTINDPANGLASKASASSVATMGNTVAQQGNAITAATNALNAFQSTVAGQIASVQTAIDTLANDIDALSNLLIDVSAMANDATAGGRLKFAARAGLNGAAASFDLMLRAGTSGSYYTTGFMVSVKSDGTGEFVIVAPKFVVTDAGLANFAKAMTWSGGTLTLDQLKVMRIQSLDGTKVDFNLGSTGGAPYLQFE